MAKWTIFDPWPKAQGVCCGGNGNRRTDLGLGVAWRIHRTRATRAPTAGATAIVVASGEEGCLWWPPENTTV
ncbi:hypothetical protein Acr_22g0004820 [Actinidia rufa]|uniref:Uncharacterized protein n=1 Tax=Actinidia rufa TaxID=165716 RepID=A0A7J0GK35_9ERIC|nr:hypothetical protein Acr_22g0004820 [Actinidia rufa]